MNIMFGLFKNTYDWYEWSDVQLVSDEREELEEYCEDLGLNLLEGGEARKAKDSETTHYIICKIKRI